MNKRIKLLHLTGSWLISTIAVILILTSLCFFIDIKIASWQFPVSFILTGLILFYIDKDRNNDQPIYFKSLLSCLAIIILSILVALQFYDVSYDGQTYHMEGIYQLKEGWNPFYTLLPKMNDLTIYINHYSKGAEVPQSTLYSMINRIEAGKATNLMLLTGVFCLCLSYLLQLNRLSLLKCVLISLLATLNPVAINQLLSTYVDGQLAILILCFCVAVLWIIKDANYGNLALLASIVIIAVNVKFTGLVFMVIFATAFLAWLFFVKKKILFKTVLYVTVLSGMVAVFIVGYNPYVVNTVKFHHPFYPLMGDNKVDIIVNNIPKGFEKKNAASKFLISLFGRTDNVMPDNDKVVRLKLPFVLSKADIINTGKIDTRIAGFGPLFSGAILLSIVILILIVLKNNDRNSIRNSLYLLIIAGISISIIPESWWARYIPQLWYVPVLILLTAELYAFNRLKFLKLSIYITLSLTIAFTSIALGWTFMMSRLIKHQLKELKVSKHPIRVQLGVFTTLRIRFQENDIPYVDTDLSAEEDEGVIVRSLSIYVKDKNVNIPKSSFIKWAEKYEQPNKK